MARRSLSARIVWLAMVLMVSLAAVIHATRPASAATGGVEFDHLKTGFALTGAHQNQRCESCHQAGVFKLSLIHI